MAASKKKSSSSSGRRSSGASRTSRSRRNAKKPIRREIGAFVCVVLALLTILACFGVNAAALNLLSSFFRGLIGAGFYILPLSFLLGFFILLLHDGRPVALRVSCAFLCAVIVGALVHVIGCKYEPVWTFRLIPDLWSTGIAEQSGGVLSGLIGSLLALLIHRIGAVIVLLAGLFFTVITSLNMTVSGIIQAIRNRPRVEYEPPKKEHRDPAETIVNHVAERHNAHVQHARERRAAANTFDLPVDDPPLAGGDPPAESSGPSEPAARRNTPIRPDEYVENSIRSKKQASDRQPEPEPEPAAKPAGTHDYKAQFDALLAEQQPEASAVPGAKPESAGPQPTNIIQMPLPKVMPPLVVEHAASAPAPIPAPPPAPVPEPAHQPAPAPAAKDTEQIKKADVQQEAALIGQQIQQAQPPIPEYAFPPFDLLRSGSGQQHDGTEEMRQNAERLNDTLQSFGIEAHITNVTRGPSVTRYELELQRGVKLSKVTNLADDIALALGASGVRIAAIPDKISVVGIEVPNRVVSVVLARDVIDSPEFIKSKSRISFAVGKDIGGSRIIGDIGKLPHMLIAGTTGSGKSVCMNSLIISLLYKAKPDEVKLIMVDPKMVELGIYNGIPHLLIPVVTDPKKAAGSLQWAVTEMMRRYRMMADAGVRDLESYNKLARSDESDEYEPMPQIVVVIDELADLMLVAAKEVEESICRIAQMGRASGIHLVIATQRPSADVITGLMKANIPSRIAFAVASAMESRIILDTSGAEKLVGKGDMLYAPLGQGKPKRVQGCFITDDEVQRVVEFIKSSSQAQYSESVMAEIDKKAAESGKGNGAASAASSEPAASESDGDEMLPAAVDVILETGQASVSMLQRRLKLGYARAARIMDEMEERGIVGPFEGSKPRQLLVTKEQWEAMKSGGEPENPPVEEEIP